MCLFFMHTYTHLIDLTLEYILKFIIKVYPELLFLTVPDKTVAGTLTVMLFYQYEIGSKLKNMPRKLWKQLNDEQISF